MMKYNKNNALKKIMAATAIAAMTAAVSPVGVLAVQTMAAESVSAENNLLVFNNADVAVLINNAESYTDGKYNGKCTNADGGVYDVTIYQTAAVGRYISGGEEQYGIKLQGNSPLFAVTLTDKKLYRFTTVTGNGSATVGLYSDEACTNLLVSGDMPGEIIYKKTSAEPEVVYFKHISVNNTYMKSVDIAAEELPASTEKNFKGTITGIESDDTNVNLVFKSSLGNVKVSADDYESDGISLYSNTDYTITAVGNKGVYTGKITTDESGSCDIALSRIGLEFPLDIKNKGSEYEAFLAAKNYSTGDVTDPYSGITFYKGGYDSTQWGVRGNANKIMSFKADKTGICKVTVDVLASNSDKIVLKVNDTTYAPVLTDAVQGGTAILSAIVKEGDEVALYTPTKTNFYYTRIDVEYEDAAFTYAGTRTSGDETLIYGAVENTQIDNITQVGFICTDNAVSKTDACEGKDSSATVYKGLTFGGEDITADGAKVFGSVISGYTGTVYVYPFCTTANGTVYGAPEVITIS